MIVNAVLIVNKLVIFFHIKKYSNNKKSFTRKVLETFNTNNNLFNCQCLR